MYKRSVWDITMSGHIQAYVSIANNTRCCNVTCMLRKQQPEWGHQDACSINRPALVSLYHRVHHSATLYGESHLYESLNITIFHSSSNNMPIVLKSLEFIRNLCHQSLLCNVPAVTIWLWYSGKICAILMSPLIMTSHCAWADPDCYHPSESFQCRTVGMASLPSGQYSTLPHNTMHQSYRVDHR